MCHPAGGLNGGDDPQNKKEVAPEAPGMLERHYAPKTKTILTTNIAEAIETYKDLKIGLLTYNDILNDDAIAYKIVLSEGKNLEEAASKLYDALHQLDQQQLFIKWDFN